VPTTSARKSNRESAAPRGEVKEILASLERLGSKRNRDGMARYAIVTPKLFGVPMAEMKRIAKQQGRDHALADALWTTGWYEARIVAALVDEPERVTAAQMDRWCRDFDNWAVCDTVCMHLFDRTPHAWRKVEQWSGRKGEFEKRAAFALLASLALHDRSAPDDDFLRQLPLIEREASDERNFVKKAVNWALRGIGSRNTRLHRSAMTVARTLATSEDRTERWIGKDAIRQLSSEATKKRVARRDRL
jgi:3-methyladenine DNA glycosylase AlkD